MDLDGTHGPGLPSRFPDVTSERWAVKMMGIFGQIMREDAERGGTVRDRSEDPCRDHAHMSRDPAPWCHRKTSAK